MPRPSVCAAILSVTLFAGCKRPAPPTPPPTTKPATTRATDPVAESPKTDNPPATVLDVIRLQQPDYPTKRPLTVPADLNDAAKIVLDTPACVDLQGNLWLSYPAGLQLPDALAVSIKDHTVVTREPVLFVSGNEARRPKSALTSKGWILRPPKQGESPDNPSRWITSAPVGFHDAAYSADGVCRFKFERLGDSFFTQPLGHLQLFPGHIAIPCRRIDGDPFVLLTDSELSPKQTIALPRPMADKEQQRATSIPVLAPTPDGVWAWAPWDNGESGSQAVYIDSAGSHEPDAKAGWPKMPVEVVPLADGSVLVIALQSGASSPSGLEVTIKLIAGPEKPAAGEQLRAVQPLARKLADRDPAVRQAAQRELERMGPSVLPMLEMMRDQVPPEAQIRIESMLGQRYSPTLAGMRLLPGSVRTLSRFPGGGCVLRFDGGGTIDADGDEPARSVIPATVLIRPGYPIELIDPESVCDFLPGRQTIQWVGEELLISDATVGPRRWVGSSLSKPILPKELADFDTVVAIDARRRWLLTSKKRPGKTLLIDPSLPDTAPKLPTWTIAGDAIGRTDAGWPAVKHGKQLFVLEKSGWRIDKADALRPAPVPLPAAVDKSGRLYSVDDRGASCTDADGRTTAAPFTGDATDAVALPLPGRLFVYTPDGTVHRFAVSGERPTMRAEATFTQNIPRDSIAWLDPAGRLILSDTRTMTVTFPEGRIPPEIADLMLNRGR